MSLPHPPARLRSAAGREAGRFNHSRRFGLPQGLFALLLSASVHAGASGCLDVDDSAASSVPAGDAAGLRVYIDPQTGELLEGPPGGETAEAAAETPQAEPDDPVIQQPDGTLAADPGDRFVTELRAEIVDGRLITCHRPRAGDTSTGDLAPAPDEDDGGN